MYSSFQYFIIQLSADDGWCYIDLTIKLSQLKISQLQSKNKLTLELEHFWSLKTNPKQISNLEKKLKPVMLKEKLV